MIEIIFPKLGKLSQDEEGFPFFERFPTQNSKGGDKMAEKTIYNLQEMAVRAYKERLVEYLENLIRDTNNHDIKQGLDWALKIIKQTRP